MIAFRHAALLFNPNSGRQSARRFSQLQDAAGILKAAGVQVTLTPIAAADSGGELAHAAMAHGCDAIIACGGDGTVHGVLQGMLGASSRAVLGVIPMGTGNVLARNIRLPFHPLKAAQALLTAEPTQIAVGQIAFTTDPSAPLGEKRYFILNAGVGLDGMGIYRASRASKARFGTIAYYLTGFRLMATYSFPQFAVEFNGAGKRREVVSQAAAFRVADLGPLVGRLTPEASLERDDLQAILFKTNRRSRYFQYSYRSALNLSRNVRDVELVHCREIMCSALKSAAQPDEKIYAQADGESLGGLPALISMAKETVALLVPAEQRARVRES